MAYGIRGFRMMGNLGHMALVYVYLDVDDDDLAPRLAVEVKMGDGRRGEYDMPLPGNDAIGWVSTAIFRAYCNATGQDWVTPTSVTNMRWKDEFRVYFHDWFERDDVEPLYQAAGDSFPVD